MSSQHKAPLAAFVVVSIACIVVVVNAVRSEAFSTFMERRTQAIVASVPMIHEPQRVMVTEARAVVKAKAGLQVTPTVVKHVVGSAGHSAPAHQPRKHHHTARAAAPHAAVPAPATAPVTAGVPAVTAPAPVSAPTVTAPVPPGHHGAVQPTPGGAGQPLVSANGHLSDAAPFAGKGWAKPKHDDHGRGDHGYGPRSQGTQHAPSDRANAASPAVSTASPWSTGGWSGNGNGNGNGRGNAGSNSRGSGWDGGRGNSWSNGSNGSANGWSSGHHGWH